MNTVTMGEVRELKQLAISAIARILQDFEAATGCQVEHIRLDHIRTSGGTLVTGLNVEVRVP